MAYQFNNVASIEPVSAADGILKGNENLYNVVSGCGPTYSASNMTVDCAAGEITHNGSFVTVAGGSAFWTLVADATNPRWTWLALSSTGTSVVVSGTAAANPSVPALGDRVAVALVKVEAAQTVAANIVTKIDKRVPALLPTLWTTAKYKTADQSFTSNLTLANITASSGNFAFSVQPSGVYTAEYMLNMSSIGGGAKIQFTGPASPTLVRADAWMLAAAEQSYDAAVAEGPDIAVMYPFGSATAFSSTMSQSGGTISTSPQAGTSGTIRYVLASTLYVKLLVVNGTTAGTVTLQGAQSASSATATTFGTGSWMQAQRVA
jgi:hypothetical protein